MLSSNVVRGTNTNMSQAVLMPAFNTTRLPPQKKNENFVYKNLVTIEEDGSIRVEWQTEPGSQILKKAVEVSKDGQSVRVKFFARFIDINPVLIYRFKFMTSLGTLSPIMTIELKIDPKFFTTTTYLFDTTGLITESLSKSNQL